MLMVLRSAWVACCSKCFGKRYKLDVFTSNFWCLWFAVSVFGVDVFNLLLTRVWVRGYLSSKNCLQWCDALMVFAICLELFVVRNVLEKDTNLMSSRQISGVFDLWFRFSIFRKAWSHCTRFKLFYLYKTSTLFFKFICLCNLEYAFWYEISINFPMLRVNNRKCLRCK